MLDRLRRLPGRHGSLYAPDVATVYVPMIDSDSYRRDLGERLTEAVVKEIELKTPYKVVNTPERRQHSFGPLDDRHAADARRERVRRSARFGNRDSGRSHLAQSPPAADRAAANDLPIPPELVAISQTSNLIPEAGQSVATSQQQAIERLAQQIVGHDGSAVVSRRTQDAGCVGQGCVVKTACSRAELQSGMDANSHSDPRTRATRRAWQLRTRTLEFPRRPLVMGIVNVTPDSFSDGGQFLDADAAVAHALQLVADGADLLDIGGESTRPYSEAVSLPTKSCGACCR